MNIPEKLRELADEVELQAKQKIEIPIGGMTVAEAHRILTEALPKNIHFEISLSVDRYSSDGRTEVAWGAYDGKHHKAKSLDLAVRMCLDDRKAAPSDLDAISAVLDSPAESKIHIPADQEPPL